MDNDYFAKKFIQLFPEHEQEYIDYLEMYNELSAPMGHVFFGTLLNVPLSELLLENKDTETIRKYVDFIEDMYANGDYYVQNIVEVTIMAYLGDNTTVLRNFFAYCSEALIEVSKSLEVKETGYGRYDIHIWYKKGKMYVDVNGENWVVKDK